MSKAPIIIGVFGMMILLIVGIALYMTMGNETPQTETTPKEEVVVVPPPPPPPPKYQTYPDHDFTGGDIGCHSNTEAAACEAKCDADDKCVSYIHTANDKLCCIKHGTPNYKNLPGRQITGYIKNVDGYDVKEVGDRVAGDIGGPVNVNLPQCKAKCDSLNNCVGFSYQNNTCYAKKAEGLSSTYANNSFQFYTKK